MATFSSIADAARGAAMGPVQGAARSLTNQGNYTKLAIKGAVNGGITRASQTAMNGLMGSAMSALNGDFSEAGSKLLGIPNDMVNSAFGVNPGIQGLPSGQASEGNALQGINARQDALLNFNWFCVPPDINGIRLPWYYVEQAALPFRNIEVQEVYRRGHHEKVPKSYSVQNLQLTFFMDNSMQALRYLQAWQNLILGNATAASPLNQGKWGRPNAPGNKGFYRRIPVHIQSVNKQEVMTVTYFDAWPTNLDTLQLVSDASGRLMAQVDFAVNDVDTEINSVASSSSALSVLQGKSGFNLSSLSNIGNTVSMIPGKIASFFKSSPKYDSVADNYY